MVGKSACTFSTNKVQPNIVEIPALCTIPHCRIRVKLFNSCPTPKFKRLFGSK